MTVPLVRARKARTTLEEGHLTTSNRRLSGVIVLLGLLAVVLAASLAFGANPLPLSEIWRVILSPDSSEASSIVWTLRLPRTVVGIAAGVAFGVSGALIQAITRNPLADPGILGVNAGAGFAIVIGVAVFGVGGITGYIWFSFIGAILATVLVYLIGSAGRGASSPVTLVLAGIALAAVLSAFSTFLTLMDQETFRSFRAWGLGSLSRASLDDTVSVAPFLVVGILLAALISNSLNAVALGDDQATALGASVTRTRILGIMAVTLLAGGGTALTGGIAFVGLMVPHVVRWFTGPDQRWIIAYTALAAPSIVLDRRRTGKSDHSTGRDRGRRAHRAHRRPCPHRARAPTKGIRAMKTTTSIPRQIIFGHRNRTIRTGRAVALRFSARSLAINSILAVVAVTVAVLSLGIGDYPAHTFRGCPLVAQGDDFHRLIVTEWRLPIAIAAILFGALLGIGGAIFQSLTRNPLGSPDVIGFDAGSYTAVVLTILVIGANQYWYIAASSLVGGLLTAIVVYLLSYRGGVQGFRLIIVGIGVSATLGSINAYLITRAREITDAMSVGFWAAGSLSRARMALACSRHHRGSDCLHRSDDVDSSSATTGTR